jgi:hypothetical protein
LPGKTSRAVRFPLIFCFINRWSESNNGSKKGWPSGHGAKETPKIIVTFKHHRIIFLNPKTNHPTIEMMEERLVFIATN